MNILESFTLTKPSELSLQSFVVNLLLALIISFFISWHYKKFASPLSNREELIKTFPFITLGTVLIISVVKSSLALSLGLVGALSIVRFRTPIKEPEELAYLFIAIATGLGLGADQRAPTIVGITIILFAMGVVAITRNRKKQNSRCLLFTITIPINEQNNVVLKLQEYLMEHCRYIALRHITSEQGILDCSYDIDLKNVNEVHKLIEHTEKTFIDSRVSIFGHTSE